MNDYDYVVLKLVQTAERFPDRVAIVDEWCDVLGNQCMVGAAGGARPGSLTASSGVRIPVTEWSDERFRAILKAIPLSPSPIGTLIMGGVVSLSDKRMPWGQIVKELGLVPGRHLGRLRLRSLTRWMLWIAVGSTVVFVTCLWLLRLVSP